jgi:hypothetical protein
LSVRFWDLQIGGLASDLGRFQTDSFPGGCREKRTLQLGACEAVIARGCAKTLRESGTAPNFEAYGLAEREKSQKFALCAAIRELSSSFRTASPQLCHLTADCAIPEPDIQQGLASWPPATKLHLKNKVIVITSAASGIGKEI